METWTGPALCLRRRWSRASSALQSTATLAFSDNLQESPLILAQPFGRSLGPNAIVPALNAIASSKLAIFCQGPPDQTLHPGLREIHAPATFVRFHPRIKDPPPDTDRVSVRRSAPAEKSLAPVDVVPDHKLLYESLPRQRAFGFSDCFNQFLASSNISAERAFQQRAAQPPMQPTSQAEGLNATA